MAFNKIITMTLIFLMAALATAQFDNPRERCRREMQESQLDACKRFIMQRSRHALMSITNKGMMERCCRELREVSPQCRCDVIGEMGRDMQEEMEEERYGHGGGMSSRRMMEMAERLPAMCAISPGHCHFRERY